MSEQNPSPTKPWYKQFWPWFILFLLGYSVVQGLTLLTIATKNPPGLISDDYYDVGKGINTSLEREDLAARLQLKADLVLDNDKGTVQLQLQGFSNPPQLVLNLISPTQAEKDRRVILQPKSDGLYQGFLQDSVSGRRFVELLGQEGGQPWHLYVEKEVIPGQPLTLEN